MMMRGSRAVTRHWASLYIYQNIDTLALTICHKELTPCTCWPSDGQSTTESCQSQDICCMCHLYAALSGLQHSVKLVRLYAALRTHTEMGHQRGISTTKSTFSRPICTDKWIIHTLYCIGQCILLSNSGSAFTASLNFFCHSIHLDNDGLD